MSVRRHLSYANVVATMALVFAMGGTAVAAKHYLITSTSQISPSALKALEAKIASKVKPGVTGKEGAAGKEGSAGKEGGAGKEGLSLLSQGEQETLKSILPYIKFAASGVDAKPTIQFSGANVQILSGANEQDTTNGAGNLIIGFDETPGAQTGSNNLVMGNGGQSYTSFGSILGGAKNDDTAFISTVLGADNTASDEGYESVTGGLHNEATGGFASVGGGEDNKAEKVATSVSGGANNVASGKWSSVSGGQLNTASNEFSSVGGGYKNTASAERSTVGGGKEEKATVEYEFLP